MPRQIMFDNMTSNQIRAGINAERRSKESWYMKYKDLIWRNNCAPIQERVMSICSDRKELDKKLMDSQSEYFKYCRGAPKKPDCCNQCCPDPCDECILDPAKPMKKPHHDQQALLFHGLSHEGGGAYNYLQNRYNDGLPETRYCFPPTTNSVYAWRLHEIICNSTGPTYPRAGVIRPQFYRSRGAFGQEDFAPYHFP